MGYNLTQINPAYELVSDVIVGTATTSVDFTGLNITKEDDYMLVSNTVATSVDKFLYANGNYTNTNYYRQYIDADGTSVSSNRINDSFYIPTFNTLTFTKIKLTNNGYITFQHNSTYYVGSGSVRFNNNYTTSTFTATSITSLRINASATNGLGIGSRFQLYKRKAPIIADITVSSATTSIDITGLSIDKGSEYMLVGTYINSSANNTNYAIYINGNNTSSNYYTQRLYASSTTVGASRYNDPLLSYANNGTNSFNIANIKLTNNGYMVVQSNISYLHGTSLIEMRNQYITSTFTINSITSIRIESATNAIGAGSRFQLIKLK